MRAVWYRVMTIEGLPTGYIGFAMGRDMNEVFWEIDQHCDPTLVQIKDAVKASFCASGDGREVSLTDEFPSDDSGDWVIPVWPEDVYQ